MTTVWQAADKATPAQVDQAYRWLKLWSDPEFASAMKVHLAVNIGSGMTPKAAAARAFHYILWRQLNWQGPRVGRALASLGDPIV